MAKTVFKHSSVIWNCKKTWSNSAHALWDVWSKFMVPVNQQGMMCYFWSNALNLEVYWLNNTVSALLYENHTEQKRKFNLFSFYTHLYKKNQDFSVFYYFELACANSKLGNNKIIISVSVMVRQNFKYLNSSFGVNQGGENTLVHTVPITPSIFYLKGWFYRAHCLYVFFVFLKAILWNSIELLNVNFIYYTQSVEFVYSYLLLIGCKYFL